MRIRDTDAPLNGDKTVHDIGTNRIDILGDDRGQLFCITLHEDGILEVRANQSCRVNGGPSLDNMLRINPVSSSTIRISREVFDGK